MNGSRTKKIRRSIYGTDSKRSGNTYGMLERVKTFWGKDKEGKKKEFQLKTGQLLCTGRRAEYKKAKKEYLAKLRMGQI